jgi:hypothetical protein
MAFHKGQRIRFPDPLEDGALTEGRFLEVAVGQPVEVPAPGGGTRMADTAWVARDDSTTARVRCDAIRPVEPE